MKHAPFELAIHVECDEHGHIHASVETPELYVARHDARTPADGLEWAMCVSVRELQAVWRRSKA